MKKISGTLGIRLLTGLMILGASLGASGLAIAGEGKAVSCLLSKSTLYGYSSNGNRIYGEVGPGSCSFRDRFPPSGERSGVFAIDVATGKPVWFLPCMGSVPQCHFSDDLSCFLVYDWKEPGTYTIYSSETGKRLRVIDRKNHSYYWGSDGVGWEDNLLLANGGDGGYLSTKCSYTLLDTAHDYGALWPFPLNGSRLGWFLTVYGSERLLPPLVADMLNVSVQLAGRPLRTEHWLSCVSLSRGSRVWSVKVNGSDFLDPEGVGFSPSVLQVRPDEKLLILYYGKYCCVRDATTGQLLGTHELPDAGRKPIFCVGARIDDRAKLLITMGYGLTHQVRVIDAVSWKEVNRYECERGSGYMTSGFSLSSDLSVIAFQICSAIDKKSVTHVWYPKKNKACVFKLDGVFSGVCVSPDGRRVLVHGHSGTIQFSLPDMKELWRIAPDAKLEFPVLPLGEPREKRVRTIHANPVCQK